MRNAFTPLDLQSKTLDFGINNQLNPLGYNGKHEIFGNSTSQKNRIFLRTGRGLLIGGTCYLWGTGPFVSFSSHLFLTRK